MFILETMNERVGRVMKKTYRIVKPIRFFVFILICVISVTFVGISIINNNHASASSVSTYKQVVVQTDGTLWDIAEDYCSNEMDIRTYIRDICEINDINPENLRAGDEIFVPIYNS